MVDIKNNLLTEHHISTDRVCNLCGYMCTAAPTGGRLLEDLEFRLFKSGVPINECVAKKLTGEGVSSKEARDSVKKGERLC